MLQLPVASLPSFPDLTLSCPNLSPSQVTRGLAMAMELQASCCRRPICFSSSVKSHAALVVRIHAKLRRPHDLCTRAFIAVFPASFAPLAAAVCIEQEQLVAQCLGAPAPPESSSPACPLLLLFIEPHPIRCIFAMSLLSLSRGKPARCPASPGSKDKRRSTRRVDRIARTGWPCFVPHRAPPAAQQVAVAQPLHRVGPRPMGQATPSAPPLFSCYWANSVPAHHVFFPVR